MNLRGWKYGLINGFAYNSSAVFRRETFGQFRDMLEQRQNAPFFRGQDSDDNKTSNVSRPAVSIMFVDPDTGDTTSPANTHSQNLSKFSTSSMPYFDGQVKDRDDNPDVNEDFTITM